MDFSNWVENMPNLSYGLFSAIAICALLLSIVKNKSRIQKYQPHSQLKRELIQLLSTHQNNAKQLIYLDSIVIHPTTNAQTTKENNKLLLLIIPGNPGSPGFYEQYMSRLSELSGGAVEVRTLAHAGHSKIHFEKNEAEQSDRIYSLQNQIDHKADYIRNRLDENPNLKIVLIGHSVGAYISLKLLKLFPAAVYKLVLLQPTIMHIAKSTNGVRMTPLLGNRLFVHSIAALGSLLAALPYSVKRIVAQMHLGFDIHDSVLEAALSLPSYYRLMNIFHMAHLEMQHMHGPDEELVQKYEKKMRFIYAKVDDWVPSHYVQDLERKYAKNSSHLVVNALHAFMLQNKSSEMMADHSWDWIKC